MDVPPGAVPASAEWDRECSPILEVVALPAGTAKPFRHRSPGLANASPASVCLPWVRDQIHPSVKMPKLCKKRVFLYLFSNQDIFFTLDPIIHIIQNINQIYIYIDQVCV